MKQEPKQITRLPPFKQKARNQSKWHIPSGLCIGVGGV